MFKLRVVQANQGDCFIIEFGKENPKYILVDGGPKGVYNKYLKKEVKRISEKTDRIELVVLTHVDSDHVTGLIDLMKDLLGSVQGLVQIKELWHNSFSDSMDLASYNMTSVKAATALSDAVRVGVPDADNMESSIRQGDLFWNQSLRLGVPINKEFNGGLVTVENAHSVNRDNLSISVVGPESKNLTKLKAEWEKWLLKEDMSDMSMTPPNLSSIMLLVKSEEKSMLLTGDGHCDDLLEGLRLNNLLNDVGEIEVDVLKIPHHGSITNLNRDFFKKVKAHTYIISGNGEHPHIEPLRWIIEEAKARKEHVRIFATNRTDVLETIMSEYDEEENYYSLHLMEQEHVSLDFDILTGKFGFNS